MKITSGQTGAEAMEAVEGREGSSSAALNVKEERHGFQLSLNETDGVRMRPKPPKHETHFSAKIAPKRFVKQVVRW